MENPPATSPVTLSTAIGTVLATGVTMFALFFPGLTEAAQVAIVAFGNSVIALAVIAWSIRHVTPTAHPVLDEGTRVTVITPAGEPNRTQTL